MVGVAAAYADAAAKTNIEIVNNQTVSTFLISARLFISCRKRQDMLPFDQRHFMLPQSADP